MKTLNCIVAILAFAFVSFGSVVPVDAQPLGRWLGRERVDRFSGETTYRARYLTGNVNMVFSCAEEASVTSVSLTLQDGISRDGTFQYRVDDSDVRDAEWTDGDEVIYTQGRRAVAFLRELIGGRELRVRIPRFRRASENQLFYLEDAATHLSEVRRRCDW